MTLEDLGNIGEIVGAIGVIGSMIYVAVQIRQNTRMIRDNTVQTLLTLSAENNRNMATDQSRIVFQKLFDGAHLLEEEKDFANTQIYGMITIHDSAYYQYYRGSLEEGVWSAYRARNNRL